MSTQEWRGRRAVARRERVEGRGSPLARISVKAARSGPVAVIGANLHGDECTGIAAAHRLAQILADELLHGEVHLYPSLNPGGLARGSRGMPGDALDPNRAFPGQGLGTPARRHAARVWSELRARRPDLLIDLHTDTDGAIPYAIVDRVVRGSGAEELALSCLAYAEASGLTVLQEYPADRYLRFELDHSLPGAMVNGPGVAAVTLEVGPRRRVDPDSVELCTKAALGMLSALGLVQRPHPPHASRLEGGPWRRESGPRCAKAGLLVPTLGPGSLFRRGQRLAEIRALDGTCLEVLRAEEDGAVVALPEVAWVEGGTSCATLAVREA